MMVGTILSIVLLWQAARGVSWAELVAVFGSARWNLIAVAVVLVLLSTVFRAWCWRSLLVDPSVRVSLVKAWQIVLVGQFLNICLPARAGDLARVYLMGDAARMSRTGTATSLALEKFFDATTLLILLGLVAFFVELPTALVGFARGIAVVTLLSVFAVVALARRGTGLIELLRKKADSEDVWIARVARHTEMVVESLRIIRQWYWVILMQAGYLGIWFTLGGVNYAVLRALEVEAPITAVFVVLVVLQLGTSVPSTPGKVGVFQYLTVVALAPFEVARESALSYGVLLHVVGYGPLITFGALCSWIGLTRKH